MMATRLLIAAAVLIGYLLVSLGVRTAVRSCAAWRPLVVLGVLNGGAFWLIARASSTSTSSVAAVAQATVPIFNLLFGLRFLIHDRVTRGGPPVSCSAWPVSRCSPG